MDFATSGTTWLLIFLIFLIQWFFERHLEQWGVLPWVLRWSIQTETQFTVQCLHLCEPHPITSFHISHIPGSNDSPWLKTSFRKSFASLSPPPHFTRTPLYHKFMYSVRELLLSSLKSKIDYYWEKLVGPPSCDVDCLFWHSKTNSDNEVHCTYSQ